MDEDIFETLRKLEDSIKNQSFNYYIYYDSQTGKIIHIRNYEEIDDPFPSLAVSNEDFDHHNISIHSHSIIEVDGKKTVKKMVNPYKTPVVDDFIHMLPKKQLLPKAKIPKTYEFDLLIEQDNVKKEFRLRLSKELRSAATNTTEADRKIVMFVTASNDPNILYKTLEVPMASIVNDNFYAIGFDDYDGTPSNIYSIRYFKKYLHLDIRK
jgi:hypothetical protein